ncbi:N-ethylmaleimide reductase [Legionella massiliensis]|uniref:N-ethylmaleimide reductase n=1 Tax=Legionella massiliensis TaxID=1034943 RepID=A0A078KXX5_9GAMM|nr:alkene reductase [Legionella massiliensis]CDZ76599.1 N-ethylmaleimide reductase [Legionella massiliensis]CEE12337.1 N-ethylmaleimide reductase [Legionella massiliensis]
MKNLILEEPLSKGEQTFKNRIFMAPMTRARATQQIPTDLMAEYYGQRASAGLIFSEAAQISPQGVGYSFTPGIHSQEQVAGWKKVTQKVHARGGQIYLQLWHVGRVSHPDFHDGALPVAPSAIAFAGQSYTPSGFKDIVKPRALELQEIKGIVTDFKTSAILAKEAGFDGVEIHGANGYLPAQFLEDGSNQRTDEYGGSPANRARFLLELTQAVIDVWGAKRVSVRISPNNPFNGMSDSNPEATYLYLVEQLEKLGLGMLHLVEPVQSFNGTKPLAAKIRQQFSGVLVLNTGYDLQTAEAAINEGRADAISFANKFIANPDLPERFANGLPLNTADPATIYGGAEKGYTDYARME